MVSTPFISLMLTEKAAWNILPRRGLCGQRRVPRGFLVRPHSATDSVRKGFVKTPNETRKREEWDLVRRIANPCLSPRNMSEALKQIRVNRAAPLLQNTIIGLRSDTRSRARVAACPPGCRFSVTRDIARYSMELISWCRGYDLSVYSVFADPKVPSV